MPGTIKRLLLTGDHVCPWWLAYTFDNPLRRLIHSPVSILGDFIREGQTVVDLGCGMGHFSLGMAKLVGENGTVVAVDIQEQMLQRVRRRAQAEGLSSRVKTHLAKPDAIGLKLTADFILAFWMVHEVMNPEFFFQEVSTLMRLDAMLLVVEPMIHVRETDFLRTVALAEELGLRLVSKPGIRISRSALFQKQ